jgi:mono/diheme cytochrome c family protein
MLHARITPMRHLAAVFFLFGILLGPIPTTSLEGFQNRGKTVWDGVYTIAQAEHGKAAYLDKCAACHKDDLSGYEGALRHDKFMQHWGEDNLHSLYSIIKTTMPRGAPASLSDGVYLDILAFILQANEFPSGADELTVAALPGIQVQGKSGPVDLPAGALVELVGCLAKGSDNAWVVTRAKEAIRTRDPHNSTPDELKGWESKPLGQSEFGLMDAEYYHPDTHKDHKVLAKGFLIRNGGKTRINLTALDSINSSCGP